MNAYFRVSVVTWGICKKCQSERLSSGEINILYVYEGERAIFAWTTSEDIYGGDVGDGREAGREKKV